MSSTVSLTLFRNQLANVSEPRVRLRETTRANTHALSPHVVEQSRNQLANVSEPGVCGARETTRATPTRSDHSRC